MGSVISMNDGYHHAVERLLPWYVTGRISAEDAAMVEGHLGDCAQCREDLATEQWLAGHIPSVSLSADEGWSRMLPQLTDGLAGKAKAAAADDRGRWRSRFVVGALAAQAACILVFTGLATTSRPREDYRALSTGRQTGGDLLVMFGPSVTEHQIRDILVRHEARIVDGPTSTGAYVVALDGTDRARRALSIKTQPGVRLAEPLGAQAGQ